MLFLSLKAPPVLKIGDERAITGVKHRLFNKSILYLPCDKNQVGPQDTKMPKRKFVKQQRVKSKARHLLQLEKICVLAVFSHSFLFDF